MANQEISQFTDGSVPASTDYVAGYEGADSGEAGGNRKWSYANIATEVSTILGLLGMSTQAANAVDITGGTIDGTILGGTTPAAANFTTLSNTGSITQKTANTTLILKQGSNGKTGTVVLNGATPVSVGNTSITANSVVVFALKTIGGTVGAHPAIQTITPSTGFTVAGSALDTSTYNYAIIESAA